MNLSTASNRFAHHITRYKTNIRHWLNQYADCEICLASLKAPLEASTTTKRISAHVSPKPTGLFICHDCNAWLTNNGLCCSHCGEPILTAAHNQNESVRCRHCQQQPPQFDYVVSTTLYAGPPVHWIQQAKDKRKLHWMTRLARWMAANPPACIEYVDALVPVPSHPWRRFVRGFDPASVLAERLSNDFGVPINRQLLQRTRQQKQRGLERQQRLDNIHGSYRIATDFEARLERQPQLTVEGKHLLIIDDVMTTGATCDLLAALLKQQGAASVGVWVLARTPPPAWFIYEDSRISKQA